MKALSRLFLTLIFAITVNSSFAAKKTFYSSPSFLDVNQIAPSGTLTVNDDDYSIISNAWKSNFYNISHRGLVELKINNQNAGSNYQPSPYVVSVVVEIHGNKYNPNSGSYESFNETKTLKLDFMKKGNYTSEAYAEIEGAHDFTVNIIQVNKYPTAAIMDIELSARIDVERVYKFNPNNSTAVNATYLNVGANQTNDFEISWGNIGNAEYYELEWIYVDNYKLDPDNFTVQRNEIPFNEDIISHNSTRIITKENSYRIPNTYGQGFLLYRVRAYGYALWFEAGSPASYQYSQNALPGIWNGFKCQASDCSISNLYLSDYIGTIASGSTTGFLYLNTRIFGGKEKAILPDEGASFIDFRKDFNYEFESSFAEDGKNAISMTFYDGSLRNRQTISRSKSSNDAKLIVAENFYDYNGRNSINSLPVPTNSANKLSFIPDFNKGLNSANVLEKYNAKLFDLDGSSDCYVGPTPFDNNSGSAKYYSPNIDPELKLGQENGDYIPISNGFPFVQTRFTPDASGRISSQSQPGAEFKLGSGHETQYYYGVPDQYELDMLFGFDAGNASHYKKNFVRDPNGQFSFSILDLAGKTFATGLLGQNPANLASLTSMASTSYYCDLFDKSFFNPLGSRNLKDLKDMKSVLSRPVFISKEGIYEFGYSYQGAKYSSDCPEPTSTCYDCIMNLKISLTDKCGIEYLYGYENANTKTPIIIGANILNTINSGGTLQACSLGTAAPSYKFGLANITSKQTNGDWKTRNSSLTPVSLSSGMYTLTKTLEVNQKALDYYTNEFLKTNCIKPLADFEADAIAALDLSGCDITCESCSTQVNSFIASHPELTEEEKTELQAQCEELCGKSLNYCEATINGLEMDMRPMGQYGIIAKGGAVLSNNEILELDEQIDTKSDALSVYYQQNYLPKNPRIKAIFDALSVSTSVSYNKVLEFFPWNPDWRFPFNEATSNGITEKKYSYLNEKGDIDYVNITKIGDDFYPPVNANYVGEIIKVDDTKYKVKPNYLANPEDFIDLFKPSWARSLIVYHPEYEYSRLCEVIASSYEYDNILLNTEEYSTALNTSEINQFLNPLGTDLTSSDAQDPFFNLTTYANAPSGFIITAQIYDAMKDRLLHYKTVNGINYSLEEFAYKISNCPNGQNTFCTDCSYDTITDNFSKIGATKDKTWSIYRTLYLSLKKEFLDYMVQDYAIKNGFYNGCIGRENFNAANNGYMFTYYNNPNSGGNFWYDKQLFNPAQPCYCESFSFYKEKTARFMTQSGHSDDMQSLSNKFCYEPNGLPIDCSSQVEEVIKELSARTEKLGLSSCGQCPDALGFEAFFNALIKNNDFVTGASNNVKLICYNGKESSRTNGYAEFAESLAKKLFPSISNSNYTIEWNSIYNSTTHKLEAKFIRTDVNEECNIEIKFPDVYNTLYNFNDIVSICCLRGKKLFNETTKTLIGTYVFEMKARVKIKPQDIAGNYPNNEPYFNAWVTDNYKNLELEGTSTCFAIDECYTLEEACKPSYESKFLLNFFNQMHSAGVLIAPSSSSPINVSNLLNKSGTTSIYSKFFADPEFFDFMSQVIFNQYGYRDINQRFNHFSWYSNINSSLYEANLVISNITDAAFSTKPNVSCNIKIEVSNFSFRLIDIIKFIDIEYSASKGLQAVVLVQDPNTLAYSYQKVSIITSNFPLGYCGKDISNFNRLSKRTAKGSGIPASSLANSECDECRLNIKHLKPFMDWFNLLLHQKDLVEPYDSFYSLSNQYLWSSYNSSTKPEDDLNMPIMGDVCLGSPKFTNLDSIWDPNTNSRIAIDFCPGQEDKDCQIDIYTIPSKLIYDVVNILSISRPSGAPYSAFEMIGENIKGEKVTIYGNSPCMNICELDCYQSSGTGCDVNRIPRIYGYSDSYETDFVQEVDHNSNSNLFDDLPIETNNTSVIQAEYSLIGAQSSSKTLMFRLMPNQTSFYKLWSLGVASAGPVGIEVEANKKYTATFSIYYSDGASQPELDAFMRIDGKIYTVSKTKTISSLSTTDFIVKYTYYFDTKYVNPTLLNPKIPLEIWVKNSANYFSGNSKEFMLMDIGFEMSCEPQVNCCPISLPEIELISPCSSLVYVAKENAKLQYEAYINRVRSEFRNAYIKKCLSAYEGFYMKDQNEKYHYTLYYYDQAGNLVRTIPPKGVVPLTQSEIDQVDIDRAANVRTVFTNHDLATTYSYNSLNQLVEQSVPDNKDLNIQNLEIANSGIPSGLIIRGIQKLTENRAYLFADDNTMNNKSRIFTTEDAGKNWKEVFDVGVNQLNKVQIVNSSIQYAIGDEGLMLKSSDAGSTWQVMFIPSQSKLVELIFIEPNKGMVFEESGVFYKTTDGGANWTGPYNSLQKHFETGTKLSSISAHFNEIYAVNDKGGIFFTKTWGTIWLQQSKIRSNQSVNSASFPDDNIGYLAGDKGLLLKGPLSTSAKWEPINTGINNDFLKIWFSSQNQGIAIVKYINGGNSYTKLQYTTNGGVTWLDAGMPSTITGNYWISDFNFISTSLGCAILDNGQIIKSTNNGQTWTSIGTVAGFSSTIKASRISLVSGSNTYAFVAGDQGNIYFTSNVNASTPSWTNFFASIAKPTTFKIVELHALSPSKVIIVDFFKQAFTVLVNGSSNQTVNLNSTYTIAGAVKLDFKAGSTNGYILTESSNGNEYQIVKYTDNVSTQIQLISPIVNSIESGLANTFYMNKTNGLLGLVGMNTGEIFAKQIDNCTNQTLCPWENLSDKISISSLNAIDYIKDSTSTLVSSRAVAVGKSGLILTKNFEKPYWILLPFKSSIDFKCVKVAPDVSGPGTFDDEIAAFGNSNKFVRFTANRTGSLNIVNHDAIYLTSTSSDQYSINQVKFVNEFSSNKFYLCGKNITAGRRAVLSTWIINTPYLFTEENLNNPPFSQEFKSIDLLQTSGNVNITVVGADGKKANRTAGVWSEVGTQPNRINATCMASNTIGYAVGDNGKIYKTTDAAKTWNLTTSNPGITSKLTSVHFITPTRGFITGGGNLYKTIDGNTFNLISGVSAVEFKDVHFRGNFGLLCGTSGRLYYSLDAGETWSIISVSSGVDLNAVQVTGANPSINNSSIPLGFAVGNSGTILRIHKVSGAFQAESQKYGANSWTFQLYSADYDLTDIYLRDYKTGYIVGKNGVIMKTINADKSTGNGSEWVKINNLGGTTNLMSINSLDGYSFFISGNTNPTASTSTPLKLYDRSDEITSRFYYDALGRLVVSQNAKQFYTGAALGKNVYSYTLYDAIGRITEVGEVISRTPIERAYNGSKMDQNLFDSWINELDNSRKQVTKTFYDQAVFTSTPIGTPSYLRHRVSSTTYTENFTGNINAYNSATHYTYDVHGNVNKIVNDLPELEEYEARFKVTEYEYDVLSGKVNQVIFQKNKNDQFVHHYEYDNLNRLTGVYTSQKSSIFYGEQYHSLWQKDAKYSYYLHGPLARTEIGNDRVQGLDYAYNLQGWLKGVNSATLLAERDMGKDGCNTCATTLNSNFAKDEMGFVLGYFEGDYSPVTAFSSNSYFDISTSDPFQVHSELLNEKKDLFNGNISYMTTAIGKFMEGLESKPNSMVYGYDQLNRLISTKRFNNVNVLDNYWEKNGYSNTDYNESFSYDPNGNILTLQRNGIDANGSNEMDNLHYFYEGIGENQKKNTNKLLSVSDDVTNYNLTGSSDFASGQSFTPSSLNGNNYNYDEIGNLIKDLQEEIEEISWNVYGKISKIRRISSSTKPDLEFAYDASGNRIKKIVKPVGSEIWDITYYLRDAQGNVMSTYTLKENSLKQDRLYIYGSSRIGELVADAKNQNVCSISISEDELLNSREQAIDGLIRNLFSNLQDPQFTEQIVSYWNIKWNDYFSQTGTMHPNTDNIQTHLFNWNAWVEWMCKMKCYENLNGEVLGIWENHWNGRLQSFYNGTITCGYEECPETYTELLTEWTVNLNNEVIPQMQAHNFVSSCSVQNNVYVKGSRRYELSNHLGNVLAVVSDRKIESDEDYFYAGLGSGYKFENGGYIADVDGEYRQHSGPDGVISSYSAEVISASDYYAGGAPLVGRSYTAPNTSYRFKGAGGQEADDDIFIGAYTAEFWEYDSRLGRRWNVDQVVKHWESGYATFSNNPIFYIDPSGKNANPVYDTDGSFLGTDDKGIAGDAIVMEKSKFTQGMKHEDAEKQNQCMEGLKTAEAKAKFANHFYELNTRPDYDGFVTIDEGVAWAKAHPNLDNDNDENNGLANAKPDDFLYLDAAKLDFGILRTTDFTSNKSEYIDLLYKTDPTSNNSRFTTYALGQTFLRLIDSKGTVEVINGNHNIYNWDNGGSYLRQALINGDRFLKGLNDSHGFPLSIYGKGKLNPPNDFLNGKGIRFNAY